jgi:hypothetical protein
MGSFQTYELSLPPVKKVKTIALKASKKKTKVSSEEDSEEEEDAVTMLAKNFGRLMKNDKFKKKFSKRLKKGPKESKPEEAEKKDPKGPSALAQQPHNAATAPPMPIQHTATCLPLAGMLQQPFVLLHLLTNASHPLASTTLQFLAAPKLSLACSQPTLQHTIQPFDSKLENEAFIYIYIFSKVLFEYKSYVSQHSSKQA